MITVGYVVTDVSVPERAGVAQLTAAVSAPNASTTIEASFFLLMNTVDGTATAAGLSCVLGIDVHTSLILRQLYVNIEIVSIHLHPLTLLNTHMQSPSIHSSW